MTNLCLTYARAMMAIWDMQSYTKNGENVIRSMLNHAKAPEQLKNIKSRKLSIFRKYIEEKLNHLMDLG